MENFRGVSRDTNNGTKLLTHIFKHYSFLGCGKCMPLSLTQIHTQTGSDITYSTAIKQALHRLALKVHVNIKAVVCFFFLPSLQMNPHRTGNEEKNLSSFQRCNFSFCSMNAHASMPFRCGACAPSPRFATLSWVLSDA